MSQGPSHKRSFVRWLTATLIVLFLIIPIGLYAWRYRFNPCEVDEVKQASTFLITQLKSYDRLYQVASTASQTSFEPPILVMQQIQVDTQEVPVPACLRIAKNELISYMYTVIGAFRAWGDGKDQATISDMINRSDDHYESFYDELDKINQCAPWCFR